MTQHRDPATMNAAQWDAVYTSGAPHWDPGGPQPAFADLVDAGTVRGRVLDAGCGSGEHVLLCAAHGLDATGVDVAPAAIDTARRKAAERGLTARFLVHDVHRLGDLGETFDTVLDSGLLHIFTEPDRDAYLRTVRAVLNPGGRMFVLCFSDQQPAASGPMRLSRAELVAACTDGWHMDTITPTTLSAAGGVGIPGWLVCLTVQAQLSTAYALVATTLADRYMEQFCRHAAQVHRIDHAGSVGAWRQVTVRRDDRRATLQFERAQCTLEARADALVLRVEADDLDTLHRIQALLTADLSRFAHREHPEVCWEPGGGRSPA